MRIGIISDTHGFLEESDVFPFFKDCDEIWHAGDVGTMEVANQLSTFKPLKMVFGNIDGNELQWQFSENLIFNCEGAKVLMTHIGGKPPNYNSRVRGIIEKEKPSIFVCGHSHILKVIFDKQNDLLFINPGAAGKQGLHKVRTAVRMKITDSKPSEMEILEMGKR